MSSVQSILCSFRLAVDVFLEIKEMSRKEKRRVFFIHFKWAWRSDKKNTGPYRILDAVVLGILSLGVFHTTTDFPCVR